MSKRIKWTKSKLMEAYRLHKEFPTLGLLAVYLTKAWGHPVSSNAIQKALSRHFPNKYSNTTIGKNCGKLAPADKEVKFRKMRILHLDIETSPAQCWTWSPWQPTIQPSQVEFPGRMLCWAAKWHGEDKMYFSSLNKDSHKKMVSKIWKLLDQADAVVHYNGVKFDIPHIQREFVELGMSPPSKFRQIDLIRTVRGQFKFMYNKLDYVCERLGLGNKLDHRGMEMWIACTLDYKSEHWKVMEEYNRHDVVLLERLYNHLIPWVKNHPNWGVYIDGELPVCRNCGSEDIYADGTERTNARSYQRYKCKGCGAPLRSNKCIKKTNKNLTV